MELFKAKINEISASIAERNNLFLIEVVLRGHDKNRVIEIYFDSEKNLDADTCASLSREIQEEMEKMEWVIIHTVLRYHPPVLTVR
jgi:ribosome maturation factor RimP